MITCRQLVELLIDFVSDELPADHRDRIEQHLQICPPCVTYIETYKLTIRLTRQLPMKPLPPQLAEHLRAILSEFCRKPPASDAGDIHPVV
jgi:anti-sigma factor RsiW